MRGRRAVIRERLQRELRALTKMIEFVIWRLDELCEDGAELVDEHEVG